MEKEIHAHLSQNNHCKNIQDDRSELEFESDPLAAASSWSFFFQYSSSGGPKIAFPETTPILKND